MYEKSSSKSCNRCDNYFSRLTGRAILPVLDVVGSAPVNVNAAVPIRGLAEGPRMLSLKAVDHWRAPNLGGPLCCYGYPCRLIWKCAPVCCSPLQMAGCHE